MSDPKHIGIILDGNRRFAKKLIAKPWKGHEFGAKKVEQLLRWCDELGIKETTLYAFSIENFDRPKAEFDYLMNLFKEAFEKVKDNKELMDRKVKINFLGRINMFPDPVTKAMRELMEATKDNDAFTVNFCMAYGGRQEIVDAARKLFKDVENGKIKMSDVDEEVFKKYLYTSHEPDLIIRTGGEIRSSNFLAYQGTYSEWFYLEKTWPEFEKEDLVKCIAEFKQRERRFGR